ncbi:MAG: YlbF family regulator [Clostridiales bacterium]|nr:YlbF family regulator [Clostridiales bacterium]
MLPCAAHDDGIVHFPVPPLGLSLKWHKYSTFVPIFQGKNVKFAFPVQSGEKYAIINSLSCMKAIRKGKTMQVMDSARQLAKDIRDSAEYKIYAQYKEELEQEAGAMALVKEFQKLQMQAQLCYMSGTQMNDTDMQRLNQMAPLLYADPRTSGYLMSQMQLQKMMADVMQLITQAADLPMDMPG